MDCSAVDAANLRPALRAWGRESVAPTALTAPRKFLRCRVESGVGSHQQRVHVTPPSVALVASGAGLPRAEGGRVTAYKVLTGIDYAGKRAEPGDIVDDLPAKSVSWLREQGHVEPVDASEPESPEKEA